MENPETLARAHMAAEGITMTPPSAEERAWIRELCKQW